MCGSCEDSGTAVRPTWTPGGAPTSTSEPKGIIGNSYVCSRCGEHVARGAIHTCSVPIAAKPSEPPQATGWLCPACGKGNAPFVSQCPCEGRRDTSWTSASTNIVCETCKDTGYLIEVRPNGSLTHPCPRGCLAPILMNEAINRE